MHPHLAGHLGEPPAAADVGQKTDAHLGHAEAAALGDDAVRGVGAEADAAAEGDAVEQRHVRHRQFVELHVEPILEREKVVEQLRVARLERQARLGDVAAGAEGALPRARERELADARVGEPRIHLRVDELQHLEREGIELPRAVQGDEAEVAALVKVHR